MRIGVFNSIRFPNIVSDLQLHLGMTHGEVLDVLSTTYTFYSNNFPVDGAMSYISTNLIQTITPLYPGITADYMYLLFWRYVGSDSTYWRFDCFKLGYAYQGDDYFFSDFTRNFARLMIDRGHIFSNVHRC